MLTSFKTQRREFHGGGDPGLLQEESRLWDDVDSLEDGRHLVEMLLLMER